MTLPVLGGYLVLGAGLGIIMREKGYGPIWMLLSSLCIYAGSMQYLCVDLLTGGASLWATALATLMVNARHLFYGISMVDHYRGNSPKKWYMVLALTDETYSLVCSGSSTDTVRDLRVTLLDHIYWVSGCVLGSVLGAFIPFSTEGVDFALTALFVTVFLQQWEERKDHIPALAGLVCAALCLVLFGADRFLIPAMALILVCLTGYRKYGEVRA